MWAPDLSKLCMSADIGVCAHDFSAEGVLKDGSKSLEIPIARIIQFLSDRSRCLHACALFPRASMDTRNYTAPRLTRLPPPPPVATPRTPDGLSQNPSATAALVLYVEGMHNPNQTYVSNVKAIYDKCVASGIDLFVYTDAPIDRAAEIDSGVNARCIFTWSRDIIVGGATHGNVDTLLDVSVEQIKSFFSARPGFDPQSWDSLYGRIDTAKLYATLEIMRLNRYEVVAYQDVGKVKPIVHFLKDPTTKQLVTKVGMIQSGGAFPENYAWITHKKTLPAWEYTLLALVQFLRDPKSIRNIQNMRSLKSTSHYATLAPMLIRQHFVYSNAYNQPIVIDSLDKGTQVVRISLMTRDGGGLLPCQYTFVNSREDLLLARLLGNAACSHFSNLVYAQGDRNEATTQRLLANLGLLSIVGAQLDMQTDNKSNVEHLPFIQCADEQLDKLLSNQKSTFTVECI